MSANLENSAVATGLEKVTFDSDPKERQCNVGDLGLIPGLGRSPEEGNGNPLLVLAWRIPWTGEPDRLQSMGSQELDTT